MIRIVIIILIFVSLSCDGQTVRDSSIVKSSKLVVLDTLSRLKLEEGFEVLQLVLENSPSDKIRIVRKTKIIGELSLPIPDVEVKNFSVDKIERTEEGFVLTVNWGGGKTFYKQSFYFELNDAEKTFYLESIIKTSFSLEFENDISSKEKINPHLKINEIDLLTFIVN
ncbi:hypothetical protein [Peijinzhouia sedimentorum]